MLHSGVLTALRQLGKVPPDSQLRRTVSLYALVPAAGRGLRFGGLKLLTPWRGQEILSHVLTALGDPRLEDVISEVFVVHRPEDEAIEQLALRFHSQPVKVPSHSAAGAGELPDTLRAGFAAITAWHPTSDPAATLICLGDQPLLRADVILALAQAWRSGALAVRPVYHETPRVPGHPMLIDRRLWPRANELTGVTGFGPLLERRGERIETLVVPGRNPDIDTPQDLMALDAQEPRS